MTKRVKSLPDASSAQSVSVPDLPVSDVADYFTLLKPRVMVLVTFTGIAGIWIAPGAIHWLQAIIAVLCIALGSGAGAALNMWYERKSDRLMKRTRSRPLPAGRIDPDEALNFAIFIAFLSVTIMALGVGILAAILLGVAIVFYGVVYTIWLKPRTVQNIVIGGAAGALPPVIGWASVTHSLDWGAFAMFALIFVWTPPHFWALALDRVDEYAQAKFPMLPNVAGDRATRVQIMLYSLALLPISLLPVVTNIAGWIYGITACIASLYLIWRAWKVMQEQPKTRQARKLFGFSMLYLFVLFAVMMADASQPVTLLTRITQ